MEIGIPDGSQSKFFKRTFQKNKAQRTQPKAQATNLGTTYGSLTLSTDQNIQPFIELDTKLDNCWVCESWIECEFQIDIIKILKKTYNVDLEIVEDLEKLYLVYIHFDFDGYDADKMEDQRVLSADMAGMFKV